jgi:RNA polymerase sigma-70 factor, ECF subfamily
MNRYRSFNTAEALSARRGQLLEVMVEEHFDYLFRYALRYFHGADTAEDVVQETFMAAAEAIGSFKGRSSPRTWLTGILRRKLLEIIEETERERAVNLEMEAIERELSGKLFDESGHWRAEHAPVSWGSRPEEALRQKRFFAVLEQCLTHLPERTRQILLLRELEGVERSLISTRLGLSSTNVGVILHRARLYLQHCLQEHWVRGEPAGGES